MHWLVAFLSDRADKVAERVSRWGHETRQIYPGYLFFSYSHDWQKVQGEAGLVKVFGYWTRKETFKPDMFTDEDLAIFSTVELEKPPEETFRPGEMVMITSGPDQSRVGIYHGQASKGECSVIELDYFVGRRKVKIATHRLASASARRPLLA